MIMKERGIPLAIQTLEALARRLPLHHPSYEIIKSNLAKDKAGLRGEQSLDYYLQELDQESFGIFHDIRLTSSNYPFQMDTLILTNHFALIIEVKNISGTLHFDQKFNQLIRVSQDGREKGFPDPFSQVSQQQKRLQDWLNKEKLPLIPIETLIVMANPTTIIKANSSLSTQKLCHANRLPDKIRIFENRYKQEVLSTKNRRKLQKTILKKWLPANIDVTKRYNITKADIQPGVICPSCSSSPMARIHGAWSCRHCSTTSKEAHLQAIEDYFLLISPAITNGELRRFLGLESRYTAKRLLAHLPSSGMKKTTTYSLPR